MTAVYTAGVNAFLNGDVDAMTATIKAQMVTDDFVFNDAHTVIGDITGTIEDPVIVSVDHVANGAIYPDPITFVEVPAGPDAVWGLVIYVESGPLLSWHDRKSDTVPIDVEPNGGNITFTFDRLVKL